MNTIVGTHASNQEIKLNKASSFDNLNWEKDSSILIVDLLI